MGEANAASTSPSLSKVLWSGGVGERVDGTRRRKGWWLGLLPPTLPETLDEGGGGREGAGRRES